MPVAAVRCCFPVTVTAGQQAATLPVPSSHTSCLTACAGPLPGRGWLPGCVPHHHADPGGQDPAWIQAAPRGAGQAQPCGVPMQKG